ncbi:hypothetical protein [Photobacterium kishitanii]|uniref:hypothetical protein n=1 Tax=Photobacterium kishitanii TaxID=318456 RepID=UPI0015E69B62|nr:hypothetical protein [Photobacterium kishitanii]
MNIKLYQVTLVVAVLIGGFIVINTGGYLGTCSIEQTSASINDTFQEFGYNLKN